MITVKAEVVQRWQRLAWGGRLSMSTLVPGWWGSRGGLVFLCLVGVSTAVGLASLIAFVTFPVLSDIAGGRVLPAVAVTAFTVALPVVLGLALLAARADEQRRDLLEREEFFRTAQKIGKLGYWRYEVATGRLVLSDNVHELLGDPGKTLDLDIPRLLEMVNPEDRETLRDALKRVVQNGSREQMQYRITGLDGVERWFWAEGRRLLDPAGKPIRAYGACQDITDRISIEAALRESKDHYRSAVELNPQIPWTADPEGNILELGPVWLELTGMKLEDSLGTGWSAALHPDDVETTKGAWSEALRTGEPLDLEYRLRLADGTYRWFRVRAAARRNDQGEVIRWYGTVEDIHERKSAYAALRDSESFARSILDSTPDCITVLDLEGNLQFMNSPGQTAMEIDDLEPLLGEAWSHRWPTSVEKKLNEALDAARAGRTGRFSGCGPTAKGNPRWWDATVSPILGSDGKPNRLLTIARDMTEEKQAQSALEQARIDAEDAARSLENVLSSTTDGVATLDHELRFTYLNPQAKNFLGDLDPVGKTHREVFPDPRYDALRQHYEEAYRRQEAAHFEEYIPAGDLWVQFHVYPSHDGVNVFFSDVSERRRSEQQLLYLAHHDTLTGLLNRDMLYKKLVQALKAPSWEQQTAFLFLDLDEFKSINDSLGHSVGDQVLVAVAQRLKEQIRRFDVIARFGGDEFAIVSRVSGTDHIEVFAERLTAALNHPYTVDGRQITVGASIGIVVVSEPGALAEDVIRDADIALYQAKEAGRGGYRFFKQDMGEDFREREELKQDLRGAAARGEFHVAYQPVINFRTSRVSGFEALLRWNHPTKGAVPPTTFIPLAENSGAIIEIGEWVLANACRDAASWPEHVSIAVNLSPVQFRSSKLVEMVSRCLSTAELAPKRLHLEITETVLLAGSQRNTEILHDLRKLGCCISMDDFGTGYSSLSYLRSFPFDSLKIDRSFVSDLSEEGGRPKAIIKGIVELSHSLGVTVTAEGVETEAQAAGLRELGCNHVQGYLFGRPMSKWEADRIVSRRNKTGGGIIPFPRNSTD